MISKAKETKMEIPEINVFGKIDTNKINLFDPPYNIRNDCRSIGQWKKGDKEYLGNKLDMAILHVQPYYGDIGETKGKQWMLIYFIGAPHETIVPKNVVCSTLIKTQSLSNLGQKLIEIMESAEPATGIFETSFIEKSGDYGDYCVLDWKWRERTEEELPQLKMIAEFLATNPTFNNSELPETMIRIDKSKENAIAEAENKVALLRESKKTN